MRQVIKYVALILPLVGSAQAVSFKATTDAHSIIENTVFEVSFTLENADGQNFKPPDFKDFAYIGGPSRSVSTTIINGRVSRKQSYTYVLRAERAGTFDIAPATIDVDGKKMRSNSLRVEVIKGSSPGGKDNAIAAPGDEDVFIRTELDTNVAYPGQQVLLDYVLYSRINVRNYNILQEDDYSNYYLRYVKDFNKRPTRVVINGMQYQSQVLRSLALFPQQTGRDTIDQLVVRLGIGVDDPGSGFFFSMRTVPKVVRADAVILNVRPLPEGAPEDFTGAVGNFTMQSGITDRNITTDDALVLNVMIRGTGDARRWSAPDAASLADDFEVYDPKLISDKSVDQGGVIVNEKRFQYRLIPKRTGQIRFQLPFTYFDPDSSAYITLTSGPFAIEVSQGERKAGDPFLAQGFDDEGHKLRALKPVHSIDRSASTFFLSIPYFAGLLLPVFGILLLFMQRRREERFMRRSPEERRRIQAAKRARSILAEAERCLQNDDARGFYEAVSRAVIGYIAGKLGIQPSDITRANLKDKMAGSAMPHDLIERVMEQVHRADQALYAGRTETGDMHAFFEKMTALFTELESSLELQPPSRVL